MLGGGGRGGGLGGKFAIFGKFPASAPVFFHEIYISKGKTIKTKLLTQSKRNI